MVKTACTRCAGAPSHYLAPGEPLPPLCAVCYIEVRLLNIVKPGDSVLDVGAGIGQYAPALREWADNDYVMLDVHLPTLMARSLPKDIPLLVGDLRTLLPMLRDSAFDVVIAIDLIEHLEKHDGLAAIREMQRVARKHVVLFTPDGFKPQEKDNYGLGNIHQRHLSGWTQSELQTLGPGTVTRIDPFHEDGSAALFAVLDVAS